MKASRCADLPAKYEPGVRPRNVCREASASAKNAKLMASLTAVAEFLLEKFSAEIDG